MLSYFLCLYYFVPLFKNGKRIEIFNLVLKFKKKNDVSLLTILALIICIYNINTEYYTIFYNA